MIELLETFVRYVGPHIIWAAMYLLTMVIYLLEHKK